MCVYIQLYHTHTVLSLSSCVYTLYSDNTLCVRYMMHAKTVYGIVYIHIHYIYIRMCIIGIYNVYGVAIMYILTMLCIYNVHGVAMTL